MDEVFWSVGRMSGIVALALFTAGVVLGVLTRRGRPLPGLPRFAIASVHRNTALLASMFLVMHVLTLLADSYARMALIDLVVPFLGGSNPFWQGLGTISFDLLIAIVATSLLRRRLPDGVFRAVHWGVYPLWAVAVLHGLGNGTDAGSTWFRIITAASVLIVLITSIWRLVAKGFQTHPSERLHHDRRQRDRLRRDRLQQNRSGRDQHERERHGRDRHGRDDHGIPGPRHLTERSL